MHSISRSRASDLKQETQANCVMRCSPCATANNKRQHVTLFAKKQPRFHIIQCASQVSKLKQMEKIPSGIIGNVYLNQIQIAVQTEFYLT